MPDLMPAWEEIPDKFKHMSTAHREKRTAHVTLNIEYDPAVATLDDLGDAVDLLVEHAVSGELDDSYGISTVWAGPVSGQE